MGWYVSMSAMLDGESLSGAEMLVNGVMHPTQWNGVAELFFLTTLGPHTYESITPSGAVFVTGEMALSLIPIPQAGSFAIPDIWPEDDISQVFYLLFQYETGTGNGEEPPAEPEKNTVGKIGAAAATAALVGIAVDASRKR